MCPTSQSVPARPAAPNPRASFDSVTLALVGSGGDGVALLGELLLSMAADQGLYGIMVQSYGPQIRGGESAAVLRIAPHEVLFEGDLTDVLLCFRASDLKRFRGAIRLHAGSLALFEATDTAEVPEWLGKFDREPYRYPFATFEEGAEVAGDPKNMLGLALVCRVLGWPPDLARRTLEKRFEQKPHHLKRNLAAFERAWLAENVPQIPRLHGHGIPLHIESGNEAIARGAIQAGLRFFAGYPITPSSEIMETLIEELPTAGGLVVQAEDEIAALGMVLGSSFGGVPSMTATSGPGLSLMTEMIGLSSMAELPCIVVDCQRAGPATGMPSRTEQADLFHAVCGGHGDFPRAVLGVFDVVHAREVMYRAMHLAENYQLPVLVLSDAYIAQRRQIRAAAAEPRERPHRRVWKPGPESSGGRFGLDEGEVVSAFRVPGTAGGLYLASGIEHTAEGSPTADTTTHQNMNAKRFLKVDAIALESADWYRTLGAPDAPRGIIAWGSQYGLLEEWVVKHPEYRVFMPEIIFPFPIAALEVWRKGLEWSCVLELSYQGQFHRYLSGLTDMGGVCSVARSGGVPFNLTELATRFAEADLRGLKPGAER